MSGRETISGKTAEAHEAPLQSPLALAALSLAGLLLAYGAASWAIDSGRLLAYTLTLVLFGLSLRYAVRCIRKLVERRKTA